jgi:SAM-dependent methyltransferase
LKGDHGLDGRPYALGYSNSEFKRLELQASLIRDLTENVLRRAGIVPGMRVLDVGCGVGDVSLLAAEIVGPSGFVLGVDRSADATAVAGGAPCLPGNLIGCALPWPNSTNSRSAKPLMR